MVARRRCSVRSSDWARSPGAMSDRWARMATRRIGLIATNTVARFSPGERLRPSLLAWLVRADEQGAQTTLHKDVGEDGGGTYAHDYDYVFRERAVAELHGVHGGPGNAPAVAV